MRELCCGMHQGRNNERGKRRNHGPVEKARKLFHTIRQARPGPIVLSKTKGLRLFGLRPFTQLPGEVTIGRRRRGGAPAFPAILRARDENSGPPYFTPNRLMKFVSNRPA